MRRILLLSLPALLLGAPAAHAHAFLDHSEPGVGATVRIAPRELTLTFTERIEPAFSAVEVDDAAGNRVDQGEIKLDGKDAATLHVPIKPLGAGTYKVKWRAVSVDTHKTEGTFTFRVTGP
jgi:copper resistance protein C